MDEQMREQIKYILLLFQYEYSIFYFKNQYWPSFVDETQTKDLILFIFPLSSRLFEFYKELDKATDTYTHLKQLELKNKKFDFAVYQQQSQEEEEMSSSTQQQEMQEILPNIQEESFLIIQQTFQELLEIPELKELKQSSNQREFVLNRIIQLFLLLLDNEREMLTEQFQTQYAALEDYCQNIQDQRIDMTFQNDRNQINVQMMKAQAREQAENQKRFVEEKKTSKVFQQLAENQDPKSILMECEILQNYCLELEQRIKESNSAGAIRFEEAIQLQNMNDFQEEEIKKLNQIIMQMENTLQLERENNKQLVIATVSKYKEKIRIMKAKLEEYQVMSQLQNQQMHEFQLQDNEEKNMYQKQIQLIESQIEQVQQHYQAVISNLKEKQKEEIEKLKEGFQKDAYLQELEEKQRRDENEQFFKNREMEQENKYQEEIKKQEQKHAQLIEKYMRESKLDFDKGEREKKQQIHELQVALKQKQEEIKVIQKCTTDLSLRIESILQSKNDIEIELKTLLSQRDLQMNEMQMRSQELIRDIENANLKIKEHQMREIMAISASEESAKNVEKAIFRMREIEQQLQTERNYFKEQKRRIKAKLLLVLNQVQEFKERLNFTNSSLKQKTLNCREWILQKINHDNLNNIISNKHTLNKREIQEANTLTEDSKNEKKRSKSVIIIREKINNENMETSERIQLKQQRDTISNLKIMLLKANETQIECQRLKEITQHLQSQITNSKQNLLQSEHILRENGKLARQNTMLRQESEKIEGGFKKLMEENFKLREKLKVKKEKTLIKSQKQIQNIQEIQQMIENSYNSLRIRGIQQQHKNTLSRITPKEPFTHKIDVINSPKMYYRPSSLCNKRNKFIEANPVSKSNISTFSQASHQSQLNQVLHPYSSQRSTPLSSIPYSSQGGTPSQSFNKSLKCSRSPSKQLLVDVSQKQQQESLKQSMIDKNKVDYEQEQTAQKIKEDNQNIISNLSKLQQLDLFLQRSRSQSNLKSPPPVLDNTLYILEHSNITQTLTKQQTSPLNIDPSQSKTIQITSTFLPHSEKQSNSIIQESLNGFSQASSSSLRRTQSHNVLIKQQ